jgi:hypothetical protein
MSARSVSIWIAMIAFSSVSSFAITFPEALDTTNLIWVTATNSATEKAWLTSNTAPHDGVDDVTCGNHFLPATDSWIQTQVVGPGKIGFWWKVSCEVSQLIDDELLWFDYLEFKISGDAAPDWPNIQPLALVAGQGNWEYRTFNVPAGTNTLRWNFHKDDAVNSFLDLARLDQVDYEFTPVPLPEALNLCAVNWNIGGDASWLGQTNVSLDGKAAESGAIVTGQESYLQMVVSGVSNVSFQWRISSLTNSDYLEFYTNSYVHDPFSPPTNYAARISGTVTSWRSNFFRLPFTATNTLTWRYVKGSQPSVAQDRGWLDLVQFGPKPLPSPFTLASPAQLPDGRFQFNLVGQAYCPCRIEFSTNFINWTTLTNTTITNSLTTFLDGGAVGTSNRFYRSLSQ